MSLVSLIKRLREVIRKDAGVDGDAQRLQQIVWLIFLMVFDYKEEEAEMNADFEGTTYDPVIPEGYRWRDWANPKKDDGTPDLKHQMTGDDLLEFVNNKLIPVLSGGNIKNDEGKNIVPFDKNDDRSLMVKSIMGDTNNFMKDGYLLREVVNMFNEVEFDDSAEAHEFNDMYESLLSGLQSAGSMGEFYTTRAITEFGIRRVNPRLGGTLGDWGCGTGGFLISALDYMSRQANALDPVKAQEAIQHAVRGGEYKPMPYKLCVTNLLLHGIELPNIRYGDSLSEKNLNDFTEDDKVEYAALNPPYGGVALDTDKMSFPADMRSSETADLFVALTVKRLKKDGRAMIVLPDGFLFGNDNAKVNVKKYLMNECNLHTVIRLPQSCFAPYTSIATNLLFFDKTGKTEETWFYRLDMPEGYKHFSKTKPMMIEHFAPADNWWDDRKEIKDADTDTYKARKFTYDEIESMGFNLDQCGYPVEEKIILSPEETMQNFIERRTELDNEIDARIEKIKALLEV